MKTTRRNFIKIGALTTLFYRASKVNAWLMEAAAIMVLVLGILAIWQLRKLCKQKLDNHPKAPDKDSPDSQSFSGAVTTISTSLNPPPESIFQINDTNYGWIVMLQIMTSTDMLTWSKCGSLMIWLNDLSMTIQQCDVNDNVIMIKTNVTSDIHLAKLSMPASDKRFFRLDAAIQ